MPARRLCSHKERLPKGLFHSLIQQENNPQKNHPQTSSLYPTQPAPLPHQVYIRPGFAWDEQKAYLFDIDGTLLRNRDRTHLEAFYEATRRVLGCELPFDRVMMQGNTDPGILRDAFLLSPMEESLWRPTIEPILAEMRLYMAERHEQMQPVRMAGVEATLAHLAKNGAALGVGTGNLTSIGWLKIEKIGLRHWFSFGGFSDNAMVRADMIAEAAALAREQAGAEATPCVVGDTVADISAARANGLPTIAVATGQQSFATLMEEEPEVCTSSLEALLAYTMEQK